MNDRHGEICKLDHLTQILVRIAVVLTIQASAIWQAFAESPNLNKRLRVIVSVMSEP